MYRGSTGKWAVECKLGKSKHIVGGKGNTSAFVQLWNSYKTSDIFLVAAGKKIPCVTLGKCSISGKQKAEKRALWGGVGFGEDVGIYIYADFGYPQVLRYFDS